jgi:2',3'-cyclic-nucleotide 2'-phosphodiesterase (5'-nucleotidase family)
VVEAERARGPALLLDAGNALFKSPLGDPSPGVRARAELLLAQMDALGTAAMAVGHRDLSLGLSFLRSASGGLKRMRLLSANLVGPDGKRAFAPSAVLEVGGLRLGVVGVSPEGEVPGERGLSGQPALPAALTEARRLREEGRVEVVVVLAALPVDAARRLAQAAGPSVDFVVQSHEGRGPGMAEQADRAWLVPPGVAPYPGGSSVPRSILPATPSNLRIQ